MDNKITIETKNLIKNFGDFTAVNGVSFAVRQSEIFGFLGPNGSGKTTTIRMMLGLLTPSQGSVQVLGAPVPARVQSILPRIGYMSQQFSLYNDLTVHQNLEFYGQAYGLPLKEMETRIGEAIALSGLEGYQNAATRDLSGGWRQRLALSAAILHHPEVLFLDEPTAGVDPVSRRAFWDLLYQLVAEGITVFITTHYMDEAEHCQRLAFIQHGSIIAQGTPQNIKEQAMPGSVLEIECSNPEKLLEEIYRGAEAGESGDLDAELYGSLIHAITSQPDKQARWLRSAARKAGVKIRNLVEIEPSLEDVFIACMQSRKTGGQYED
jgi:ABC-2 type transport system ATP-binding protein